MLTIGFDVLETASKKRSTGSVILPVMNNII
jgi:hypothetical protein